MTMFDQISRAIVIVAWLVPIALCWRPTGRVMRGEAGDHDALLATFFAFASCVIVINTMRMMGAPEDIARYISRCLFLGLALATTQAVWAYRDAGRG